MMSRRTVVMLCRSFAKLNFTPQGKAFPKSLHPYHHHHLLPILSSAFSTTTRRCEDMKIISNNFDEDRYIAKDENDGHDFHFEEPSDTSRMSFQPRSRRMRERTSNHSRSNKSHAIDFDFETEDHDEDHDFSQRNDFPQRYQQRPQRWRKHNVSHHEQPRYLGQDEYSDRPSSNSYHRRPRQWVQNSSADFHGSDISHATRLRNRYGDSNEFQPRQSMEDLWSQVKDKKTNFDDTESLVKDFYEEHSDVTERAQEEVQKFSDTHQMTVTGPNKKRPIFHFGEAGFPDEIVRMLRSSNFEKPTPIQSIGWPHALSGSDMVGIAQTGSGKTLSFLLPAMLHIQSRRKAAKGNGPFALVMCPTRELANQCNDTAKKFSKFFRSRSVSVYGGQGKHVQEEKLRQPGLDLVIATPGRLLDFLSTEVVSLEQCSFVVLDEADRMLDMGFEPQIRAIMGQIRPDRQVLMWSATWPEEIQDLASDFLKNYVHVKIGAQTHTVNSDITQEFEFCEKFEKMNLLLDHLARTGCPKSGKPAKTLVFCSTKRQCSAVQSVLFRKNIYADTIHGDKSQLHRDKALYNFRVGRTQVLIASDVAARGIDVNDIEYVVNYDLPNNIDGYIHRVGRTGRAGKRGIAISYMTAEDLDMVGPIVKILNDVGHEVPDLLHGLLQKREKLKSYRRMDRRNARPQERWSSSKKYFRF